MPMENIIQNIYNVVWSAVKRNRHLEKFFVWVYRLAFWGIIIVGAILSADSVWTIGDIGLGLTTWVNVIVLLIIFPEALRCLKEYESGKY